MKNKHPFLFESKKKTLFTNSNIKMSHKEYETYPINRLIKSSSENIYTASCLRISEGGQVSFY